MKIHTSILTAGAVVLFILGSAGAAVFTDDFDRADIGPTTDGALIGANYVNSIIGADPLKDWEISGAKLVFPEPAFVAGGGAVLYNTSIQTLTSTTGSSFSVAADVTVDTNNRWVGVTFNYQDKDNYCALRIAQQNGGTKLLYQFAQVVGGALSAAAVNVTDNDDLVLGQTYNVSVAYHQGTDNYTLLIKDGATILNGITMVAGSAVNAAFVDGYGGLYASGINMNPTYDNLRIEAVIASPAGTFLDDFNRADAGPSTVGVAIGLNYVNGIKAGDSLKDWAVSGNELVFPEPGFVDGGNAVLYNTTVQTLSSITGTSFTIEADVTVDVADRWVGIAFNLQDSDHFYGLRIQGGAQNYQFIQNLAGAVTAPINTATPSTTFVLGETYHLSVSYEQSTDVYTFLIKDGSDTVLNSTTNILGTALSGGFSDGYGGLYASGINMNPTYDNLSIISLDPFGPIRPATIVGWSAFSSTVMRMVVDAPDAASDYYPKSTTDLVSGTWVGVGHSTNGLAPFVTTNLAYSTETEGGTNEVIYVQASDASGFFGIGGQ